MTFDTGRTLYDGAVAVLQHEAFQLLRLMGKIGLRNEPGIGPPRRDTLASRLFTAHAKWDCFVGALPTTTS